MTTYFGSGTRLRLAGSMILLAGVLTSASFVVPTDYFVAPAEAQSCPAASTFLTEFRWSDGSGGADNPATTGAQWPVGTMAKTWTDVGGSGLDVSMSINDPFDRLIDPGTSGVNLGGDIGTVDPFPTSTNEGAPNDGAYGNNYLTLAIYTQSSDEIVDLDFTFNQPVFLAQGFSVDDIDSVGFRQRPSQVPMHSFQDEVGFTATSGAANVPVNATPVSAGALVQVNAGTVTAIYTPGVNGGLNPNDPLGQVTIDTTTPFDAFSIHYSNGPDDQIAELADAGNPGTWDGVNNGQAVRLGGMFLCEPFASSMTLEKGAVPGHSSGADCATPLETVSGLVEGQDLTYCFTLNNTGAVDLDGITFDDATLGLAAAPLTLASGTLPIAPGSSATYYYETSAPANNLTNTATAIANPVYSDGSDIPFMTDINDTDTANVEVVMPAIDLQKTVYPGHTSGAGCAGASSSAQVPNGSAITYCFTATNSGVVDLTNVGITDATLGSPAITATVGTVNDPLLPGQSVTYYYETTSSGALINTANANGVPSDSAGDPITGASSVSDSDDADISPASPAVVLLKTAAVGNTCPGAELINPTAGTAISYCFEVQNTGDTYLVDAAITDADIPGFIAASLVPVSGSLSLIAPGTSAMVRYDTTATVDVLPNTAAVTAEPATSTGVPYGAGSVGANDTANVDVQNPSIELIKTAVPDGTPCDGVNGATLEVADGSNVSYCFTVNNTGDTDLINLTIDDATLGIVGLAVPDIAVGASASAGHGPVAATDLVNIATVTGTPAAAGVALPGAINVQDSDDAIVSALAPGVTLNKTVLAGSDVNSCPGSELVTAGNSTSVVYCFEVVNSGETFLDSFVIADPTLGINLGDMTPVGVTTDPLAPGASNTYGFVGAVSGDVVNTATVTANPVDAGGTAVPGSSPVSDDDTAEVNEVAAAIDIVKTVYTGHDAGASCAGANSVVTEAGDVTYCFVATNSSAEVHLANITLDDPTLGVIFPGAIIVSAGDPTLVAPGASVSFYYEATAASDVTNTATTTGTPADGAGTPIPTPAPTANDDATVDVVAPGIALAKTGYAGHDAGASCDGTEVTAGVSGAPVTYCFTITNTGDTHLNGVTLDDVTLGINLSDPTLLAPGESVTLSYETTITADLVNSANTSGTPSDAGGAPLAGIAPPTDTDTAEVVVIAPDILIDKTIYNGSDAGAQCGAAGNVAVALTGEATTYCFAVTNTGDTTLNDVTVTDPTLGISLNSGNAQMLSGSLASMVPGATATLYLDVVAGAADVLNIADASGTPVDGGGTPLPGVTQPTDSDDAVLNVIAPSVTLAKTVSVDGTCPGLELAKVVTGASVTYCFDISNTGDTHVIDASIDDDIYGTLDTGNTTPVSGALGLIAPGETATVSFTVTATSGVVNTATTTAQPAESDGTPLSAAPTSSGPDSAEVQIVNPSIAIAKTDYAGHNAGASCPGGELVTGLAGDAVTYCFTVTNTGDVTLTALAVDDATLGINVPVPGPLAPGASATVIHEATIIGDLVNSATATGDPAEADGTPLPATPAVVSAPDTAEVAQVAPGITIEKTVYEGHDGGASCSGIDYLAGQSGDTITYCFAVTNTGDTHLSSVTVDDLDLGLSLPVPGPIAPGSMGTVFVETTMTADLINNASATGTPSNSGGTPLAGIPVVTSALNPAEVDIVAPDISLEKTVSTDGSCPGLESVSVSSGDAVTYCFLVTNQSDVALSGVTIDDPDLGITDADMTLISGDLTLMEPLDVASLSYATTATADLLNTASATGQPAFSGTGNPLPGTVPVTDSDTANVDVVLPGLSIAKTVSASASCPGSELLRVASGTSVTYCFEITNTGDGHLSNVTIADDVYGTLNAGNTTAITGSLTLIAPSETIMVGFAATVTADELNTASATGQPSDGLGAPLALPPVTSADDTAEVQVITPGISIAKTNYGGHDSGASCDGGELVTGVNGDDVTYCFSVTNTGDVHLTNVTVDDTDLGVVLNVAGPIAPGASATVFSEQTIAGDLVNTATSTGSPSTPAGTPLPGTSPINSAPDTAEVDEISPAVSLAKTNYPGHDAGISCDGAELVSGLSGDAVTYCFTVTNTGDTSLVNIDVDDPDLGITLNIPGPLAPAGLATVFYESTIAGDLINTATATGTPSDVAGTPLPGIGSAQSAPDTAAVNEVAPGITVAKTVYAGHDGGASCAGGELATVSNGDAVTYCFEVTNNGDVDLTSIAVDDADLGVSLPVPGPIAPAASASVFFETTATGDLVNSATSTGSPSDPGGTPLPGVTPVTSPPDTAEVDVVDPGLSIAKTVYPGHNGGASCDGGELVSGLNGADVTYCFTVTNTGGVSLTDITVDDTDLGISLPVAGPLAPLATATVFHETTITGDLINTADATATPSDPGGTPLPGIPSLTSAPDTAEVREVGPGVSLSKTNYAGHDAGASCDGGELVTGQNGDAVTYCFTVTNTGDTNLINIDVDDTDLGITLNIPGPVAPGATATVSYEDTISGDLLNTATATGTAADGVGVALPGVPAVNSAPDTAEVDQINPAMAVEKTVYTGHDAGVSCAGVESVQVQNGDAVTYCFLVRNTGDTNLTSVTVTDGDLGISLNAAVDLAPGETTTLFHETTATADLVNSATSSGTPSDPGGTPIPGIPPVTSPPDTAEVDVVTPSLAIAKTVYTSHDAGASCDGAELSTGLNGDEVTYCFTVTNNGDVDLTNITVDDSDLGISLPVAGPIAPGASATVFHETTIAGDLVNTATSTGTSSDPGGTPLPGIPSVTSPPDTAEVDEVGPGITLAKTNYAGHDAGASCPGGELVSGINGDAVTYCFTVTNTGDTSLVNIDIDDPDLGITLNIPGPIAPGASATVFTEDTINGDLINTAGATATASDPAGTPIGGIPTVVSAPDTAEVNEINPDLDVAKTVYVGHDAGASCSGGELVTVANGDAVTYCFTVTNTGDVDLNNITVDDADLGISLPVAGPIAPGGTATVFHETTGTTDLINTADATGTPSDPGGTPLPGIPPVTSPTDTAEIDVVTPALTIAKTVYAGHDAGASCDGGELVSGSNSNPVTYCFTVTNTGDVDLTNITVDDADLGISLPVAGPIAPGGTAALFFESTITGDLVNNATSTGTPSDPGGTPLPGTSPVASPPDTAEVDEVGPGITLAKTNYAGHDTGASCGGGELVTGLNGDAVTYCFTVTNTGDTNLVNIDIDDTDLGITLNIPGPLAPGASATVFTEDTITSDLINTATAVGIAADGTGTPLPGVPAVNSAPDTAEVSQINPDLELAKTVYAGSDSGASCDGGELVTAETGSAITYCFTVTNTGDVDLTNITVDDADLGISLPVAGPIAPAGTATVFYETTVTGDLVNTADATGTPSDPGGTPLPGIPPVTSPPDTAEVDVVAPGLDIAKTVYSGHDAGASCDGGESVSGLNADAVTYCFTVTNTGEVDLTNITVDDADLGISLPVAGPIAPAGTATVFHETVIAGDLTNTATSTATPSDPGGTPLPGSGPVTSPPNTAEVDEVDPSIAIIKTNYAGHDGGASCDGGELVSGLNGDAVTYCFTVTNTGDTNLVNIDVDDADLGITLNIPGPVAPGATATVFSEENIAGDLVNTATATGTPADGAGVALPGVGTVSSAPDTAEVNEINPALTVAKTAYAGDDGGLSCAGAETVSTLNGDAITYCFLVTNTGDVNLTSVTVDDPDLGITVPVPGAVAPGATATVFYETTSTGDLVNTATATGTPSDPPGTPIPGVPPVTSPPDTAEVDEVTPSLSLEKTVYAGHDSGAGCATAGELVSDVSASPVTFCFEVTNSGDTHLDSIVIDDASYSLVNASLPVATGTTPVAPGASVTFYLDENISADVVNTATATGTPTDAGGTPLGVTNPSDTDTAEVDLIGPGLDVAKTVSIDGTCPGVDLAVGEVNDAVSYCFIATNSGDTHLVDLTLSDATLGIADGDMTLVGGALPLAPGAAMTFSYASTITADLVNTVDGSAQPSDAGGTPLPGVSPVNDSDFAEVQTVAPAITVSKTVSIDGTCPGNEIAVVGSGTDITWCLEATNNGDTALTNIIIDDPIAGLASHDPSPGAVLLPGESMMVPTVMTATTDETNVATFTADPSDAAGNPLPGNLDPVSDNDDAAVDVVGASIDLAKTVTVNGTCAGVEEVTAGAGFAITYCFEATNTGDTHLDTVDVSDPSLGISAGTLAIDTIVDDDNALPLSPGGTVTFHADTVVAGSLVNTATASGDPVDAAGTPIPGPGGLPLAPVTDDDTATVNQANPAINIIKTVYVGHDGGASCAGANSAVAPAGSLVTWCYEVTNTSVDTTLAPTSVDDTDLAVAYPGAIIVATGDPTSVAPAESVMFFYEDTSAGDFVNTASATGVPVDGAGDPIPGASVPPTNDTAEITGAAPSITINKTVANGVDASACAGTELVTGPSGTDVVYCFEVVNNGDIDLANVVVEDIDLGVTLTVPGVMAPFETVMLSSPSSITADLLNTATVTAEPADVAGNPLLGTPAVTDSDTAEVDLVGAAIVVAKTVYLGDDAGALCATNTTETVVANSGDIMTWCFEVTNTGDTALDNLALTDAPLGITQAEMVLLSGSTPLLPGESILYAVTTITDSTVNNTVTADADALDGSGNVVDTVTSTDTATQTLNQFDVVVTKAVQTFDKATGGILWTITTVNNGPGIAPGPITLTDELSNEVTFVNTASADWTCSATGQTVVCNYAGDLGVGESLTLDIQTTLTISAKGKVDNSASVLVNGALVGSETNLLNNNSTAEVIVSTSLPVTGASSAVLALIALGLMAIGSMMILTPRLALIPVKDDDDDDDLDAEG